MPYKSILAAISSKSNNYAEASNHYIGGGGGVGATFKHIGQTERLGTWQDFGEDGVCVVFYSSCGGCGRLAPHQT